MRKKVIYKDQTQVPARRHNPKWTKEQKENMALRKSNEIKDKKLAGTYVSPTQLWSIEDYHEEIDNIYEWFLNNPDSVVEADYFVANVTGRTHNIGITTLRRTKYTDNTLMEHWNSTIKPLLESRIVNRALNQEFNGMFAKFVLINRYGWKDKKESSVELNDKTIKFKFGNDAEDAVYKVIEDLDPDNIDNNIEEDDGD